MLERVLVSDRGGRRRKRKRPLQFQGLSSRSKSSPRTWTFTSANETISLEWCCRLLVEIDIFHVLNLLAIEGARLLWAWVDPATLVMFPSRSKDAVPTMAEIFDEGRLRYHCPLRRAKDNCMAHQDTKATMDLKHTDSRLLPNLHLLRCTKARHHYPRHYQGATCLARYHLRLHSSCRLLLKLVLGTHMRNESRQGVRAREEMAADAVKQTQNNDCNHHLI